jgi:hypothetical protein
MSILYQVFISNPLIYIRVLIFFSFEQYFLYIPKKAAIKIVINIVPTYSFLLHLFYSDGLAWTFLYTPEATDAQSCPYGADHPSMGDQYILFLGVNHKNLGGAYL